MRTTPSRFSAFVASVDPNLEARPATLNAPQTLAGSLSVLEQRHPAIVRTLTLLWGYPELNEYFDRISSGGDPRVNGLEPAAMAELMLLSAVHQHVCAVRPSRQIDDVYGTGRWSGPWRPARYRG